MGRNKDNEDIPRTPMNTSGTAGNVCSPHKITNGNTTSPHVMHTWLIITLVPLRNLVTFKREIQGDSKRSTQLNSKRRLNTRQTIGCGIPRSLLALPVDEDETHAAQ